MTARRSGSEEVRDALRRAAEEGVGELDELTRARLEKKLLGAVARGEVSGPEAGEKRRSVVPVLVAGGVIAAAAAALFVMVEVGTQKGQDEIASGATYRSFEEGETVGRGAVAVGQTVETSAGERVEVRIAASRVDVTPGSVARFDRLDRGRVEVQLSRGAVEVEFHPARRGEESLVVETQSSRVEVVGTIFRVEVDLAGSTTVRVVEGVVRVVPHDGSDPRLVHAGEETVVASLVASREPRPGEERAPWLEGGGEASAPLAGEPLAEGAGEGGADRAAAPLLEARADEPGVEATETAEEATEARVADEPSAAPLSNDARFDLVESLIARGRHAEGRHLLHEIARSPSRASDRARAWTLIAESHAAERDHAGAAEAYRRAAQVGGRSIEGQNALYALARLREQRMNDRDGAVAAYRRYLEVAPSGANARLVRTALCRLGEREHCE
jgi:hypothetical protein